jgi:DNA-binding NarL/FixJ family response regulator
MKTPIRIMIVEDHPQYREAIELALADEPDIELVSKFGAAEVALRNLQDQSTRKEVNIVLLDLNLPGMSGLDAIPWFKKYAPNAQVIVLTQSDSKADILRAIQSGAAGYLLKSAPIEEITQGIRTVNKGGASLDADVARLIIQEMQTPQYQTETSTELTPREMEIITLLSEGLVKKEIANQLKISAHTVAEHVKRIYVKLNVQNAPAAVAQAYKTGIFS